MQIENQWFDEWFRMKLTLFSVTTLYPLLQVMSEVFFLFNLKLIKGTPLWTKSCIAEHLELTFSFDLVIKVECLLRQHKSLQTKVCYTLQELDCSATDLFVNDFTTEDTVEQHILEEPALT